MPGREQNLLALAVAQRRRLAAVREREALVGVPVREVFEALVHPSEDLAAMQLRHLFGLQTRNPRGPIPRVGPRHLQRAIDAFNAESFRRIHQRTRLRELTERERRRLVRELIRRAPRGWREAA